MGVLGKIPVEFRTLGVVLVSLALCVTSLSSAWFVYKERNVETQQWTSRYEYLWGSYLRVGRRGRDSLVVLTPYGDETDILLRLLGSAFRSSLALGADLNTNF